VVVRDQRLTEHFEKVMTEPSDVADHLSTFLDLVDELNATKVIELGVRYGVSTVAWLYALEGRGHLWAVDCSPPVIEPTMEFDLLNPLMDLDHWDFILANFHKPEVKEWLPAEVDIIFLDANHVHEETMLELEMFVPLVRSGGRFLLHDTAIQITGNAVTPQPPFPVRTAMLEYCEKHDLNWTNNPVCNGLGQIYVP
jgi:cephalosporin hydroxylase